MYADATLTPLRVSASIEVLNLSLTFTCWNVISASSSGGMTHMKNSSGEMTEK